MQHRRAGQLRNDLNVQVPQHEEAVVGSCLGTLYGGMHRSPQMTSWARHMHVRPKLEHLPQLTCCQPDRAQSSLQT